MAAAAVFLYHRTRVLEKQLKNVNHTSDSSLTRTQGALSSSQEPQLCLSFANTSIYDNAESEGLALENLGHGRPDNGAPECNGALVRPEQIYTRLQMPRDEAGTACAVRSLRN